MKYIERVFQCKIFTIRDNNDEYIDVETETSISNVTLMFYNRCKCKRSKEHYEENPRRVLMIIHYKMERLGGYRLNANTHRFFNERIENERLE